MSSSYQEHMMGVPFRSLAALTRRRLLPDHSAAKLMVKGHVGSKSLKQYNGKDHSLRNRVNKLGRKADSFAHGFREHMRLGPKITETVKGKLSLGARIVKVGGLRKVYENMFRVSQGEKLLKASHCYLSTTAGPIAGLLFISTHKIAFCSDRSLKFSSPSGDHIRFHYKVVIPVGKVMRVNESVNVKKASQKYIQIVTVDNFEFWFMGFLNYRTTFNSLQGVHTGL
ncbi:GEM-like protein 4 [Momordica charantia]|uniref:GEM-like protein 4 n=1 Tax=Momordica charantia TaxID=3673 RepID=A0A6J1CBK1_MOMCH|nr:GEM-like protein 4 [Momordica charantia]